MVNPVVLALSLHRDASEAPSLTRLWLTLGSIAVLGFWLGRRWPSRALPLLAISALWIGAVIGEAWDTYLRPAMRHEVGVTNATQVYLLTTLAILAPFIAMLWKRLHSEPPAL